MIEIGGSKPDRRDSQVARALLGDDDDFGVRGEPANVAQQLEAGGRERRVACTQIDHHHVGLEPPHQRERLLGHAGGGDLQIGEDPLELGPQDGIVSQYQELAPMHHRSLPDSLPPQPCSAGAKRLPVTNALYGKSVKPAIREAVNAVTILRHPGTWRTHSHDRCP